MATGPGCCFLALHPPSKPDVCRRPTRVPQNLRNRAINWCSGTTTPWEDDVCTKYANQQATTIEGTGTKIATLFVQTTNECPSNKQGPGGCYPGSTFLQNQIASDPGLAQEANWGDVNALVGTMADQIVAGIC